MATQIKSANKNPDTDSQNPKPYNPTSFKPTNTTT